MNNSMRRRALLGAGVSGRAAATRHCEVRIGLLAIAGMVVLGDEARGQVGVESDREVLEAFYHATGGPDWLNSTNWLSTAPLSEWHGVETNPQGRVQRLVLKDNRLSGSIPSELPRLTRLEVLQLTHRLSHSELSGPIPPELGQLTSLRYLVLDNNQLSGPIPPELGQLTNLRSLQLNSNRLSGPIPPELGRLVNLDFLRLDNNRLGGSIPPELGQLRALRRILALAHNELSGPIPPELGRLVDLERSLFLNGNQLSGPIPPELGRLANLKYLVLDDNQLSGPIPPELGQLTGLEDLRLQGNQLAGPIPVELGNLTGLTVLTIDGDTGLCLPPEIQDTGFGQLAVVENDVPLCGAVTAIPPPALWVLALALLVLGLRRDGVERQPAAS